MPDNTGVNNGAYGPQDVAELDAAVNADLENVEFNASESNAPVQGCPLCDAATQNQDVQNVAEEQNEDCTFTTLKMTKSGRKFDFELSCDTGVLPDANGSVDNIFEVVSGDKKSVMVKVEKPDLVGPCAEHNHIGNSWDVEGEDALADAGQEIEVFAFKSNPLKLEHYLPFNHEPKRRSVIAISCGTLRRLYIKAYPDTELKLSGDFILFDASATMDDDVNVKSGQAGKLNLELKRNKKRIFKRDLVRWDNKQSRTYPLPGGGQSTPAPATPDPDQSSTGPSGQSGSTPGPAAQNSATATPAPSTATTGSPASAGGETQEETVASELFGVFQELKEKFENFRTIQKQVFKNFNDVSPKPLKLDLKLFNFNGKIGAKWLEVPGSRYCDYEFAGSLNLNPLFSMKFTWDFTNLTGAIPYLGQAILGTKGLLKAFDAGDLSLRMECLGEVKMKADNIKIRKKKIGDATLKDYQTLKSEGRVGVTLKAQVNATAQLDIWMLKVGGTAHAEAGLRSMFADSDTIYKKLRPARERQLELAKGARKRKELEKIIADLDQYSDPAKRECRLYIDQGKLICNTRIGFTGFLVYSIVHAQAGISLTSSGGDRPVYQQAGAGIAKDVIKDYYDMGRSGKWGSKKEKLHGIILSRPVLWDPEFTLLGESEN